MTTSGSPPGHLEPVLRRASAADLLRLWLLDRICFEPGIAYSQGELRHFFDLPGAECVVAEKDKKIAGFALGYPDPPDRARVVTLDVDPSFRRRGLGRRLLESLLERLAAAGAVRAVLEVDVRNSGAIAFYRELGFGETGRIAGYYGPGRDAFEMSREESPGPKVPRPTSVQNPKSETRDRRRT
ncbi:MAG TPA: GNAT family N-acetyltransferase [Thermoanaerobaculia bacterium]|jgi:ribosomal-protein-alanine N-acetyltransferase|nr:GNAT family N-acetyltransferase [Thermoanaerobaculia bacterium]